jgi:hypothetical protein
MGNTTGKILRKLEELWKALKGEGRPIPVPVPTERPKCRPKFRAPMFLLPGLLLAGCQLTDHTEREVTADALRFPASGYENVNEKDLPKITFEKSHFDMGQVVQGSKVSHTFSFKNTGGSALVLTDVRGSCGCTVGREWPKHPVKPGEKGTLEVVFDSEGRSGRQDKTVTVVANTTPPSTVLTLSGEVVGPSNIKPLE